MSGISAVVKTIWKLDSFVDNCGQEEICFGESNFFFFLRVEFSKLTNHLSGIR